MARIQVAFGVTQRTSQQGNEYYLIEMRTTDKNGNYRELPDVRMTPFSARLLLEHLPELCEAIKEGERQKEQGGPPPQVDHLHSGPAVDPAQVAIGPDGIPQPVLPPTTQTETVGTSTPTAQPLEEDTPF